MATNSIIQFSPNDTGTNLLTDAAYLAASDRSNGNQPGIASAKLNNKALRQASLIAAGVAQFIADRQATNVVDTLTPAQIAAMLAAAASGRLLRILRYRLVSGVQNLSINGGADSTTGAGIYTPSSAMAFVLAQVQGGGNAGAGASLPTSGNISMGAPGGCGAFGSGYYTAATIGASQTVTVGAGGAGASGAAGGVGGASSFGALLSCPGGVGSNALNNFASMNLANGNGSYSGAPSGANLESAVGFCGTESKIINIGTAAGLLAGSGQASRFGPGGQGSLDAVGSAAAATHYGAGGGAAISTVGGGAARAGGAGAGGVIFLFEYAS